MDDHPLPPGQAPHHASIAAVERDIGLSKDILRIWERRYGFPQPGRDAAGERCYPPEQVEKLRVIKFLLDAGHRPGRLAAMALDELLKLCAAAGPSARALAGLDAVSPTGTGLVAEIQAHVELIKRHDAAALRQAQQRWLARVGLGHFVREIASLLNAAVGDAWLRGHLEVFEEHLYTEAMQATLRQAIAALGDPPPGGRPRVLLATFPGEPHGLGLLMAQAMLALEGCACVPLGTQLPLWDTVRAATALRADIVALSFSGCLPPNQVVAGLVELRAKLPAATELWAGGSSPALHRRRVVGVAAFASFADVPAELQRWRAARVQVAAAPATPAWSPGVPGSD